jgi:hypothetical protein
VSLQHVSVSGYLLGEVIEPPSNAQHWSKASSRAGAAGVWRRNPAGDVSILSRTPTREREKKILPGSGLTKLVFLWICGQTRQVIAEGEGLPGFGLTCILLHTCLPPMAQTHV